MAKRRKGEKKAAAKGRTIRAKYPNGRVEVNPDDGRHYPPGTMLSWDEDTPRGREGRWCVTGGGWPFDD